MADPEQIKKNFAFITNIIRAEGAALMAAGPVIGFNLAGAANAIGLGHGDIGGIPVCRFIGGIVFVTGLSSYFFIPVILRRAREKADKDAANS